MNGPEEFMIEARVFCKVNKYILGDLGITLEKGEVIFLSQEEATQSKDLQRAKKYKAVEVTFVERYKVKKDKPTIPAPPYVRRLRAPHIKDKPEQPPPPPKKETLSEEALNKMEKKISDRIDEKFSRMEEKVASIIKNELKGQKENSVDPEMMEELKSSIGKLLSDFISKPKFSDYEVRITSPPEEVEDDTPIFIPTDLTKSDSKSRVEAEITLSGEGDDFASLAEALKKAKRNKKK